MEGFYVKVGGDFFAVKGVLHPPKQVVAVPAYIRSGERYVRMRSLERGVNLLRKRRPDYLRWVGFAGQVLPLIPIEEIEEVYDPREFSAEGAGGVVGEAERFRRLLERESGVKVGVSGSLLIGLGKESSDIDLVVYGAKSGELFYQALKRLRRLRKTGTPNNAEWIRETRGDSKIMPEIWLRLEKRKLLTGTYQGRLYTAKIVPEPHEYWESLTQRVDELGRTRIICEVIGDKFAKTTPNLYRVKVIEVLSGGEDSWRIEAVMSMRSRFAELAEKGDIIEVEGRLERVVEEGREILRVFLGNNPRDRIIPWR